MKKEDCYILCSHFQICGIPGFNDKCHKCATELFVSHTSVEKIKELGQKEYQTINPLYTCLECYMQIPGSLTRAEFSRAQLLELNTLGGMKNAEILETIEKMEALDIIRKLRSKK